MHALATRTYWWIIWSIVSLVASAGAAPNDWAKALSSQRAGVGPTVIRWEVERKLPANPTLAALAEANHQARMKDADAKGADAKTRRLYESQHETEKKLALAQVVHIAITARYVNQRHFVIETTFEPATSALKLEFRCRGDVVYQIDDRGKRIEIHPEPSRFLEELLRGIPAFAIPDVYVQDFGSVPAAEIQSEKHPDWRSLRGKSREGANYELRLDGTTLAPKACFVKLNDVTVTSIELEDIDPASKNHEARKTKYASFNNDGSPFIEETWNLISVEPLKDPKAVDASVQLKRGYRVQDHTGPEVVNTTSDELLKAK